MPGKRDIKLDEYGIGQLAYRELYNFCLQYPEKQRKIADLRSRPHYGKEAEAYLNVLLSDCKMIEQAAFEAGGEDYQFLLLAVTEDVPHHYLQLLKGMKTGVNQFGRKRRHFFYCLAIKRKIIFKSDS